MKTIHLSDTCPVRWLTVVLCTVIFMTACKAGPSARDSSPTTAGNKATDAAVVLHYGEGAQVEFAGPGGRRVFIDVTDPEMTSGPPTDRDILLTTHLHNDHYLQSYVDAFPGEQLFVRQGEIRHPGLLVRGIAAAHSEHAWDEFKPSGGTNYIFLIEMAGIRLAHFGDIGQKQLTDAQLAALGRVDVAITQFVNSYSQMNLDNKKGYRLMAQLQPRIIIPHHGASNEDAIRLHMDRWDVACVTGSRLALSRRMLPERTTVLLMGEMVDYLQKTLALKAWP